MAYDSGFPEYIPVAEKRRQAQKSIEKLKKKKLVPDLKVVYTDKVA